MWHEKTMRTAAKTDVEMIESSLYLESACPAQERAVYHFVSDAMTRGAACWPTRTGVRPANVNTNGFASKEGANMATLHRERVEHALNELLVRIVPEHADEDEDAANQRFEDAYDFAIDELTTAGDASLVPDVQHIASLIDRKGKAMHTSRLGTAQLIRASCGPP
jgi:hypothetical protein